MAYGEKQMNFAVCDGVNTITQEMEFDGKVLTVEVRISEKYGFVDMNVTNHATGDDINLDVQLEKGGSSASLEARMTTCDNDIGTLTRDGFDAKKDR